MEDGENRRLQLLVYTLPYIPKCKYLHDATLLNQAPKDQNA